MMVIFAKVFNHFEGATIARCLKIQHPCAKLFVDLSSTQSEKFGDGTTTAMLYASELLKISYDLINKEKYSLEEISKKFLKAKEISINFLKERSEKLNEEILLNVIKTVLISKQIRHENDLFTKLMLDAVKKSSVLENIFVDCVDGNFKDSELIEGNLIYSKNFDYFEPRKDAKIIFLDIPKFKSSTHLKYETNDFLGLENELIDINVDVIFCSEDFPYDDCNIINQNIMIFENIDQQDIQKISQQFELPICKSIKNLDAFICQNITFYDKNHVILQFNKQKISTIIVKSTSSSVQEEGKRKPKSNKLQLKESLNYVLN